MALSPRIQVANSPSLSTDYSAHDHTVVCTFTPPPVLYPLRNRTMALARPLLHVKWHVDGEESIIGMVRTLSSNGGIGFPDSHICDEHNLGFSTRLPTSSS